jgi:large subunit ribosomal protein L31
LKTFVICVIIVFGSFYKSKGEVNKAMKEGIHPNYAETTITSACGNVIEVGSTKQNLKVDVCSKCHPFWTGNLKRETTGGRADKFKKKYGIQ